MWSLNVFCLKAMNSGPHTLVLLDNVTLLDQCVLAVEKTAKEVYGMEKKGKGDGSSKMSSAD